MNKKSAAKMVRAIDAEIARIKAEQALSNPYTTWRCAAIRPCFRTTARNGERRNPNESFDLRPG